MSRDCRDKRFDLSELIPERLKITRIRSVNRVAKLIGVRHDDGVDQMLDVVAACRGRKGSKRVGSGFGGL